MDMDESFGQAAMAMAMRNIDAIRSYGSKTDDEDTGYTVDRTA
jgi:hypothetical protein